MILDEIVAYKRKKIEEEKRHTSLKEITKIIDGITGTRNFKKDISQENKLNIIAEIKKASPSKGIIKKNFLPIEIAKIYEGNQVEAISVLTEDKFFKGDNSYLKIVREVTSIPLLRKDFIIDSYQIHQSKALGADAILLIAGILTKQQLMVFQRIAKEIGLDALVEIHNKEELDMALETDAEIIGINNRDLKTFTTSLKTTEDLIKFIPKDKLVVSESGIHSREDMLYLQNLGVNAVLIGESLMRASSIDEKLKKLRGGLLE